MRLRSQSISQAQGGEGGWELKGWQRSVLEKE